MNVWDNVAFGLRRDGVPKDELNQRVEDMLQLVQLQKFAQRSPHQLSGGQQQRIALARALVLGGNERMSLEDMLVLANEMEGHPDNVAAAIFGGANIAWQDSHRGHMVAQSVHIDVDARISALAFIPATSVATSKARKMLPESLLHADAVRNTSNAALLVHALEHRPDLLHTATADFLHQSYRKDVMPQSFALLTKLRNAGVAAFISGAGPTVLVLHTGGPSEAEELRRAAGDKFVATELGIARQGANVISA